MIANGNVNPSQSDTSILQLKDFDKLSLVPVWIKGVFLASKHRAHVGGMLFRGIKVRVITDAYGQVHFDAFLKRFF